MRLAYAEAERLDVHWIYTNIYLLDVHNRILGGELLADEAIHRSGVERLREWARGRGTQERPTSSTARRTAPCN
jgi:hypothetical protein